jgi:hypothetical protein
MSFWACGGGGGSDTGQQTVPPHLPQAAGWERFDIIGLERDAPLQPQVAAVADSQGRVHIFYYKKGELYQNLESRYLLHHLIWDSRTTAIVGTPETIPVTPPATDDNGLNNSYVLSAALTPQGAPLVVYQGGQVPQAEDGTVCNATAQGDLMLALFDQQWSERLVVEGDASAKNPFFTDGYVGLNGSVAVDGQGNVHTAAQHYYEFCDWNSSLYPNLLYARHTPDQIAQGAHTTAMEQVVDEPNVYSGGAAQQQSSMGNYCKLVLNDQDSPLLFYVGTPSGALDGDARTRLRLARPAAGVWTPEDIEILDEWRVEGLSAAVDGAGTPAVAYYVTENPDESDYPDHLRFAQQAADGTWETSVVDNASHCGEFCSLAFDGQNRPAVAYYDLHANTGTYRQNQDLRFARYVGGQWVAETVATSGDIGKHNSLWFDGEGTAYICTYEANGQQIVLFRKRNT